MKGIGKLAGMFIKIVEISFIVLAILIVFFDLANYTLVVDTSLTYREVRLIGDALLSCDSLTTTSIDGYPVKGLFEHSKLSAYENQVPPCIKFSKQFKMQVTSNSGDYIIGDTSVPNTAMNTTFPVAVKPSSGETYLTTMRVFVYG